MRLRSTVGALILVVGCGPLDRPTITKGDAVPNLVEVSFGSEIAGEGRLVWSVDDREHVVQLDSSGTFHEGVIWIPAGRSVQVRGEVVDEDGKTHSGPKRRVRVGGVPAKLKVDVLKENRAKSQLGDGKLLLNAYDDNDSYGLAIDHTGDVYWWTEPESPKQRILRMRPGLDGQSIVYARWPKSHKNNPDDAWITRRRLSPRSERTDTRAVKLHHDFVETSPGQFAWLSWVYEDDRFVSGLGSVRLAADAIRVGSEGAVEGEETVIYDFLTDYHHDPTYVCGHMTPDGFAPGDRWEWSHSNSIAYDAENDSVRVLARYWDAVLDIGLDGTLNWEAGGLYSDFDTQGWFHHGHASELDGDHLVVFDNGNHKAEPIVSAAVGLQMDHETGVVTESFRIEDPAGLFTDFLGDVRVLPGGNLLVLYSPTGRLHEYTPDGELVWEARFAREMTVARLTWTDALSPTL